MSVSLAESPLPPREDLTLQENKNIYLSLLAYFFRTVNAFEIFDSIEENTMQSYTFIHLLLLLFQKSDCSEIEVYCITYSILR